MILYFKVSVILTRSSSKTYFSCSVYRFGIPLEESLQGTAASTTSGSFTTVDCGRYHSDVAGQQVVVHHHPPHVHDGRKLRPVSTHPDPAKSNWQTNSGNWQTVHAAHVADHSHGWSGSNSAPAASTRDIAITER